MKIIMGSSSEENGWFLERKVGDGEKYMEGKQPVENFLKVTAP